MVSRPRSRTNRVQLRPRAKTRASWRRPRVAGIKKRAARGRTQGSNGRVPLILSGLSLAISIVANPMNSYIAYQNNQTANDTLAANGAAEQTGSSQRRVW